MLLAGLCSFSSHCLIFLYEYIAVMACQYARTMRRAAKNALARGMPILRTQTIKILGAVGGLIE